MKLIDVLQKMKVADLKKEISKQNIKGYSKLKKTEIIKIMTDRPDKFKYLLLQNMNQKKELLQNTVKLKEAKEKIQKLTAKKIPAKKAQQAEVIKPKPKREPMIPKIIKTKTGIVTVKPKKLSKEEQQTQEDKLSRLRIKKKLIEYEKTLSDDPATRDKRQFTQLKKIIGKNSTIQKKKRRMIRDEDIKLYEKLKKLNFFESIDIDKEEIKPIKPKKEEPKEESKEKEIKPKKEKEPEPKTLKEMEKKETKLDNLIKNVEDTIYGFKSKLTDEQDKQRTKLVNQKIDLQEERILLKKKIVNEKDRLYNEKQKENDKKEEKKEEEGIKKIKKVVEDFIKNPTEELLQDIDNSDYFYELSEELQEKAENAIEKFLKKEKKKVKPKKELSTIEEKEIFEKENLNLGTFQKYDNKIYEKANFSFKKPVNNDKLINIIEKNPMVIIRAEIINHFERIIYKCRENVLNLKNALKLKNKNIKWKDLNESGSLKDFLNEVKNQKLICLTEKQLNKILKLNILSINDINKYKATLKEEKDLMEKFKNK